MSCRRTCAVWAQLLCFYSFMFYILHLSLENIYLECRNLSTTMCKSSVNCEMWLEDCGKGGGPLSGGGRSRGFEWQYKEWQRYADRYSGTVSRASRASSAVTRATAQHHPGVSVALSRTCLLSVVMTTRSKHYLPFPYLLCNWMMKCYIALFYFS